MAGLNYGFQKVDLKSQKLQSILTLARTKLPKNFSDFVYPASRSTKHPFLKKKKKISFGKSMRLSMNVLLPTFAMQL